MKKEKDSSESAKGGFKILNSQGLHTRPSTELVKLASTFRSDISLIYRNMRVNAKSILGILTLGASKGARIQVEATGEDAPKAVEELLHLAENSFHSRY